MAACWFLYVLRCGDGTLYTGIALDVEARLEAHRAGRGARYTKGRGPLELVHREAAGSRSAALKAELGGDVVSVTGPEPETLRGDIAARFGEPVTLMDGVVRIERADGHRFVAGLGEAFPGRIDSITVARPTLEDVFIHKTGKRLA